MLPSLFLGDPIVMAKNGAELERTLSGARGTCWFKQEPFEEFSKCVYYSVTSESFNAFSHIPHTEKAYYLVPELHKISNISGKKHLGVIAAGLINIV